MITFRFSKNSRKSASSFTFLITVQKYFKFKKILRKY